MPKSPHGQMIAVKSPAFFITMFWCRTIHSLCFFSSQAILLVISNLFSIFLSTIGLDIYTEKANICESLLKFQRMSVNI